MAPTVSASPPGGAGRRVDGVRPTAHARGHVVSFPKEGGIASGEGHPHEGLLGATLGFFFGFAAVATFGPAANEFDRLLQLGPVMVGLLVAVPSLSGSLLRIPFAMESYASGSLVFVVLAGLSLGLAYLLKQVRANHLAKIAARS